MEEGFRLAGAFVSVSLQDNTQKDLDKLKAKLESLSVDLKIGADTREAQSKVDKFKASVNGTRADMKIGVETRQAEQTIGGLRERVSKTDSKLRVSVNNPLDAAWKSRIDAALKSTALEGLTIPLNAETVEFHQKLEAALAELSRQAKVAVSAKLDEDSKAELKARVEAMTHDVSEHTKLNVRAEVDEPQARETGKKLADVIADGTERGITNGRMSHMGRIIALSVAGGLIAGAPLVAGAAVAIGGAATIAIAGAIAAGSPQIKAAWGQLMDQGRQSLTTGFATMTPILVNAIHSWGTYIQRVEPMFERLSVATVPFVNQMSHSLQGFTTSVLGGFIRTMQDALPVTTALGRGIEGLGKSFAGMLANLDMKGAGASLASFFNVLNDALPMLGSLMNTMAPLGKVFLDALNSVEHLITGISDGLSPAIRMLANLLSPLSGFIGTFGIGLFTASKIAKVFGTSLTGLGSALKGLAMSNTAADVAKVGESFNGSSTRLAGFLSKARGGPGIIGNLTTKLGGLGAAIGVGGVFGLAMVAGGLLLDGLAKKQEEAAQKTEEHKQFVDTLAGALTDSNGVIDSNVRATTAKMIADSDAGKTLMRYGWSLGQITGMTLDNTTAIDKQIATLGGVGTATLDNLASNNKLGASALQNMTTTKGMSGANRDLAFKLLDTTKAQGDQVDALQDLKKKSQDAKRQYDQLNAAVKDTGDKTLMASSNISQLEGSLKKLGDVTASESDKISALQQVLKLTAQDGTEPARDGIEGVTKAMMGLKGTLKDAQGRLTDSLGHFDLLSDKGMKANDAVIKVRDAMIEYAQKAYDSGQSTRVVDGELGNMRDRLEKELLPAFGNNKKAVDRMLDSMGLVPSNITTQLALQGAGPVVQELGGIQSKLLATPGHKTITVSSLTAEAKAKLESLGYQVKTLKNGQIQITAKTDKANTALANWVKKAAGTKGVAQLYASASEAEKTLYDWVLQSGGTITHPTIAALDTPSRVALAKLIKKIASSGAPVTIDGNRVPANASVATVMNLINGSHGEIDMDADPKNAEKKRKDTKKGIDNTRADVKVGAKQEPGFWDNIGSWFKNHVFPIRAAAPNAILGKATGGPIFGPGTSTSDSIPAMLSDGEYVINADAASHYGPGVMAALNAKKLASGGPASGGAASTAAAGATGGNTVAVVQNSSGSGSIDASKLAASVASAAALTAETDKLGAAQLGSAGAANAVATTLAKLKTSQTVGGTANQALASTLDGKLSPSFGRNALAAHTTTTATNVLRQSQTPLQAAISQSANNVNQNWSAIQNRIVTSANHVTSRQVQMQGHQAASWNAISGTVAGSVTHQRGSLTSLNNGLNGSSNTVSAFDRQARSSFASTRNAVANSVTQQRGSLSSLNSGIAGSKNAIIAFERQAKSSFGAVYRDVYNPIHSAVAGPINKGIIGAWNSLDKQFALGKHVSGVPMFADGGRVYGAGHGTSDSIPAMLSNGEFVIKEKVARQAMPFLNALNNEQGEALQATGGPTASLAGYAEGGIVANTGSAQKAAVTRGVAAIHSMTGKPYIWGGSGANGADCSGLVSIITNALRGDSNIYHRLGVANSQPWAGFTRGLNSAYGTGFNSHHTASTLAGLNAEARDKGIPILSGPAAAGAKSGQFTGTASLPFVGGKFVGGGGGGGIDFQAEIDKAFAGTGKMLGQINARYPGNIAAQDGTAIAGKASSSVQAKAMDALMASPMAGAGGGVQRWSPLVLRALAMLHQSPSLLPSVLRRMQQESGGDPGIVNTWDSNAKAGHPSTGLMQTIQGTFDRYAGPFAGKPMTDPMANIYAALNYALHQYGSVGAAMNKSGGYDNGGPLPPGITQVHNNSGKVENVQTSQQRDELRDELRGLRADIREMQMRPQVTVQAPFAGTIDEQANRVATIIERRFASQF